MNLFRIFGIVVLASSMASANPITIQDVPAYLWYHGCGPTAAASIMGYWDLHGYAKLFDASGAAVYSTVNVQDEISSPTHNAKYDSTPDNSSLPVPLPTSIADFFHTSEGGLGYGWSYQSYAPNAFTGYASYRGYSFNAWDTGFGGFSWSTLVSEINLSHPMMFLVDSNGDASTDHFVPVIGYDDRGTAGLWYGAYTTWTEDETVQWFKFQGMQSGDPWGIGYATFVQPATAPEINPVPEPSSLFILSTGIAGLAGKIFRRSRKRSGQL